MKQSYPALKVFLLVSALFITAFTGVQSPVAADRYRVYFGTTAASAGKGIFTSVLDVERGLLTEPQLTVEAVRPGIVALHPAGTHLYSIGRPAGYTGPRAGSVCAFRLDRATGSLTLLNVQESGGVGPCYLQVDSGGRNILVCHYMSGNCGVLPIAEDGSLQPLSCVVQHTGSSVHPRRQTDPHPHAIILDAAERYVLVPDLGLDQVLIYKFDPDAGMLTPNDQPFAAVEPGGGPRHIARHPVEPYVYVNLELTSEVTAFRYDAEHGILTAIQTLSTLPDGYTRMNANAGICPTPDGRFLYVTNRGHNSIAQFAVDPATGKLTSLGFESTRGDVPQTIAMDPSGRCVVVTDRRAGHAAVFRVDRETGLLSYTGCTIDVPNVNSVVFLPWE